MINRDQWMELNVRALGDWFRLVTAASPSGRVLEFDGVIAGISPETPGRSVFNSVVYETPAALESAYVEVAAAYAESGCAWTVWVPREDQASARLLEHRGHSCDALPRMMGMELDQVPEPDLGGLDWTAEGSFEDVCMVNDSAYGWPAGTWRRGLGAAPPGAFIYVARVDGEPAATVISTDHPGLDGDDGPDCSIWCVGTLEAARGRGLAKGLMGEAVFDARVRGCATSTLQSTKLGRPVYERVGYRDFGAIGMWESRPPELAAEAQPKPAA